MLKVEHVGNTMYFSKRFSTGPGGSVPAALGSHERPGSSRPCPPDLNTCQCSHSGQRGENSSQLCCAQLLTLLHQGEGVTEGVAREVGGRGGGHRGPKGTNSEGPSQSVAAC